MGLTHLGTIGTCKPPKNRHFHYKLTKKGAAKKGAAQLLPQIPASISAVYYGDGF